MELISREMAIDMMRVLGGSDKDRLMGIIANLPTIEEVLSDYAEGYKKGYIDGGVTELMNRPKGKWIKFPNPNHSPFDNSSEYTYTCNNCGRMEFEEGFYCRLCGAKMESEE